MARRDARWLWACMAAYLAIVAVAVLAPQPLPLRSGSWLARLRNDGLPPGWLADVLRNWLLFLPLGAGGVLSGLTRRRAVAAGAALSLTIELIQLAIPGRFGSPVDWLANTSGAATGAALMARRDAWIAPPAARAERLSLAAAAAAAALLLATSALLEPAFPAGRYYGGWTPELARFAHYSGRVLAAEVGAVAIVPAGPEPDSRALREALRSGSPWVVRAVAGTPPATTAPVVTVHDARGRELLFVGIDGGDLVFRRRTRAVPAGLESPWLRWRGALRTAEPGDALAIRIAPGDAGARVDLGGEPARTLAWTAGRSWAFVTDEPGIAPAALAALDAVWIAALVFPAAYWAGRRPVAWLGIAGLVALLAFLPRLGPLAASPPSEWLGAAAGALGGLKLARRRGRASGA